MSYAEPFDERVQRHLKESQVRELAQSDPVPNLTANLGATFITAQKQRDAFVASLRHLDEIQEQLAARGVAFNIDLGPIGNAAAAARRDLERQKDKPTFEMPRV